MSRSISSFLATFAVAFAALLFAVSTPVFAAGSTCSMCSDANSPASSTRSAAVCRPLQVRNTKGAKSFYVAKGQHLIRCAGADGKKGRGVSHCTADLPCANGSVCNMKMTCATSDSAS